MKRKIIIALSCLALLSCGNEANSDTNITNTTTKPETVIEPKFSTVSIVQRYAHSNQSYTQGLLISEGKLYESTGQYGESKLIVSNLTTGKVDKEVQLPSSYFGEGLALLDNKLYQLTWMEQKCLVYDKNTLKLLETLTYQGQGWGIVAHNDKLITSDGSSTLSIRDPKTFKVLSTLEVKDNRGKVNQINEMEIIDSLLYANIYLSPLIAVIDLSNGQVVEYIDCSKLFKELGDTANADVLNGIAYDSIANKLYLTGKLWDVLFEVRH